MIKQLILGIFLSTSIMLVSQDFQPSTEHMFIEYPLDSVRFHENNKITLWSAMSGGHIREGWYDIENVNGVDFLKVTWEDGFTDRFLILANDDLCFLYTQDGEPYLRGFRAEGGAPGEAAYSVRNGLKNKLQASSSLSEGDVYFGPDNLHEDIGVCWAEGVDGYGINETITIDVAFARTLHISNGFVSFDNPHLYRNNARPKKIRITIEGGYDLIIDLEDTPHIQSIDLPEYGGARIKLTIEILEVYPGLKHEDTCINMILVDGSRY